MLLDLLVHPEGPRLRDHISHGELDIMAVSEEVATYVLMVGVAMCLSCGEEEHFEDVSKLFILVFVVLPEFTLDLLHWFRSILTIGS